MIKPIPLNMDWCSDNATADLKAIYQRPRRDRFGDVIMGPTGAPLYDLTAGLPLRRHNDWLKKGYVYVTLADVESFNIAVPWLRSQGHDPKDYLVRTRAGLQPWDYAEYAKGVEATEAADAKELRELVQEFGSSAVQKMKRKLEPGFVLPEDLRGIKGTAKS